MSLIRPERPVDYEPVRALLLTAFGRETQPQLADRLRATGQLIVALVAEEKQRMLGHVMFSKISIVTQDGEAVASVMALLAVLPAFQRLGIGSALVSAGLESCRQAGYARVLVAGDPAYFTRFGFVPAMRYGVKAPLAHPENSFMALELAAGAFAGASGGVRYGHAFDDLA
ncbi:MAG: N-acetyltransferase [Betaproteobacteria bacterium]